MEHLTAREPGWNTSQHEEGHPEACEFLLVETRSVHVMRKTQIAQPRCRWFKRLC